ncbi:MAG: hypothetical protein ACOVP5_05595 [Chitinophagales bacterium]
MAAETAIPISEDRSVFVPFMILEFHDTYKEERSDVPLERIDSKLEPDISTNIIEIDHSAFIKEDVLSNTQPVIEDIEIRNTASSPNLEISTIGSGTDIQVDEITESEIKETDSPIENNSLSQQEVENAKLPDLYASIETELVSETHRIMPKVSDAISNLESSNMTPITEEILEEKTLGQDVLLEEIEDKVAVVPKIDLTIAESTAESKHEQREFIIDLTEDVLPMGTEFNSSIKLKGEPKSKQEKITSIQIDANAESTDESEDFTSWLSRLSSNTDGSVIDSDQIENEVLALDDIDLLDTDQNVEVLALDDLEKQEDIVKPERIDDQGQVRDFEVTNVMGNKDLTIQSLEDTTSTKEDKDSESSTEDMVNLNLHNDTSEMIELSSDTESNAEDNLDQQIETALSTLDQKSDLDTTLADSIENSSTPIDPLPSILKENEKPSAITLEPKIQISKDDELINALADPFLLEQKLQKHKHSNVHFSEELSAMDFISETMAILLVKQGNVDMAKAMYIKLIGKFPEKSTYFTSQIEKINQ